MLPRILLSPLLVLIIFWMGSYPSFAADGTPPQSTISLTGNLGNSSWYTSTVAVNIFSEDLESGVKEISYSLDGGELETTGFATSGNDLPNPSFETGSIDGWMVGGAANFSQDSSQAKFGSSSAKIISSDQGYKYWQTETGLSLTAGKTYVLSAWVKYSSVIGVGVKIFLDTAVSETLTGSSDWTRLALIYTPLSTGIYTPKLGIDGPGVAYFDGAYLTEAAFPAQVGFVISTSGPHNLSYFAVNNEGSVESSQSVNFKIDSQGPTGWRDLTQTEAGNDHTFSFSIRVSDQLSGLSTATGRYQYSLDGGATWGHYSDLSRCNSGWIQDGWIDVAESPGGNGIPATTLTSPATDFCDSDFSSCEKKIRFQISDVAGNTSSKDHCLNSAWFELLGGDLHSVSDIIPSSSSQTDWLVTSSGIIGNVTSSAQWIMPNYTLTWTLQGVAAQWRSYYWAGARSLPGGKLPGTGSGYYKVPGSFTIDRNTLPDGLSTANVTAVIFIDGNLSVDTDFTMPETSAYVFVVTGDVLINGTVKTAAGIYLALGKFDDHSGGPSNNPLTINGAVWSMGGFNLSRDLGKSKNTSTPAERFELPAAIFLSQSLKDLLAGEIQVGWTEADPEDLDCGS
ncbi:MAG TPA: carbohydrate binding domain-containing protein [Patescibacteria group bacterium]|nr:carbohydrate binding domain-containing protein [Patescibacteria group bacterium]